MSPQAPMPSAEEPHNYQQGEPPNKLASIPPGPGLPEKFYNAAGTLALTAQQIEILIADIDNGMIEIRPDGLIYVPEMKYRERLNAAFKPGGWALVPIDNPTMIGTQMSHTWALFVNGKFAGQARGGQAYFGGKGMTYDDAAESCKSNALVRCCKDLTMFSKCWDRAFVSQWLPEWAEELEVWIPKDGTWKTLWKRKDRPLPPPHTTWRPKKQATQLAHGQKAGTQQAPARTITVDPIQPPPRAPQGALQAPGRNLTEELQAYAENIGGQEPETVPANQVTYTQPQQRERTLPVPPREPPNQQQHENYRLDPEAPRRPPTTRPNPPPYQPPAEPAPTLTPEQMKIKETMAFGKITAIQSRATPNKPTVYGMSVDKNWHTTKDKAVYDKARELKAKDCLVRIVFHLQPFDGGVFRLIDSLECILDPTEKKPTQDLPQPPAADDSRMADGAEMF